MSKDEEKAAIEAVLFTMGSAVETDRLAQLIEEDRKTTKKLLDEMLTEYAENDRGL